MGEIKRQTINGVKWTFLERFSIQFVTFFIGLVVARLLTPQDYGLIGLLGIFITISNILIDSGFGNALVRKADASEKDFYTAFIFSFGVALFCGILIFFASPLIADFFNQPLLSPISKLMSIELIIGPLGMIPGTKLYKSLQFKTLAKINFISSVSSGVVGLAIAFCGGGVWALVAQGLVSTSLSVILKWSYEPCRIVIGFSKESFHQLFGYGSKLTLSSLINSAYSEATTFAIGKFYSASSLGNYTRGKQMATLPVNIVNDVVGKVTFPILSKIQNDDNHLIRIYREYISLIMMLVVFACMLLASIARPLVLLLLTSKWESAVIYLQIFTFAIMFDPICSLNLNLLQVKGRSDLFLKLEIIKKSIGMLLLCVSIPFGVIAICLSKVIYTQVAICANTYYTGKLFGLGYWKQMLDFMPYLGFSIVACMPAYLLSVFCPIKIVTLVLGVFIAIVLYVYILKTRDDTVFMKHIYPVLLKVYISIKKKMTDR